MPSNPTPRCNYFEGWCDLGTTAASPLFCRVIHSIVKRRWCLVRHHLRSVPHRTCRPPASHQQTSPAHRLPPPMAAACPPTVILVIAASGTLGSRVALQALAAGHTVNVLVRSLDKLSHAIGASNVSKLGTVTIGSAVDTATLHRAVASSTAVIECLGNADRAPAIQALISSISSLPPQSQPSLIVLGGLPALNLNAEGTPVTDHPRVAPMAGLARMHLATLQLLRASSIHHWTQVCPSRMTPAPDGRPSGSFRPRIRSVSLNDSPPSILSLTLGAASRTCVCTTRVRRRCCTKMLPKSLWASQAMLAAAALAARRLLLLSSNVRARAHRMQLYWVHSVGIHPRAAVCVVLAAGV
jgi:putative NADH-flavin reductase